MSSRPLEGQIITSRLDDVHIYQGVRTRRIIAFIIDYFIIALLLIPFAILIFLLGLITLGLGWSLFAVLAPAVGLLYVWFTLGGSSQSTMGMAMMGIRLERLDERRVDGMMAVMHTVLFWAGNAILTPLILLAPLILERKRTVHDLLLGTVVTRTSL